jgi:hypothetical protein
MKSAAYDVAAELATLGKGTAAATSGWGIFVGREPDRDAVPTTITCFDIGAGKTDTSQNRSIAIYYPQVQIRVRDLTYEGAFAKLMDCVTSLRGVALPLLMTGARYFNFQLTSGPMFLGRDQRDRYIHVATITVTREAT